MLCLPRGPMFAHRVSLGPHSRTRPEKSWARWRVCRAGPLPQPAFAAESRAMGPKPLLCPPRALGSRVHALQPLPRRWAVKEALQAKRGPSSWEAGPPQPRPCLVMLGGCGGGGLWVLRNPCPGREPSWCPCELRGGQSSGGHTGDHRAGTLAAATPGAVTADPVLPLAPRRPEAGRCCRR